MEVALAFIPVGMLILAIGLRCVAIGMSETPSNGWTRTLLTRISYFLLFIAAVGMIALSFFTGGFGIIGFFFICILLVALVTTDIRFAGIRNRARQIEMLWVLAIAVKSGRPLADEIEAYADGSSGKRHRLLLDMSERLREGASLTEIVVPQGLIPTSAAIQIHAGIASGALDQSLMLTATRFTDVFSDDEDSENPGTSLAYPPALLTVLSLVVGFLLYYIVPKFLRIFDDFNTELPDITRALVYASNSLVEYWFIIGLPVLLYLPLALCIFALLTEYFGWQVVLQWLLGRWFVRWHSPDVFRALSISTAQKVPIEEALVPIMKYSGPIHLRRRLAVALDEMEAGVDNWDALKRAGIINSREAVVIEIAQRSNNLPWVLDSLASQLERRRMFRLRVFLEFVQPLLLIPVGLVVGFVAIAMFIPIVKLINDLS